MTCRAASSHLMFVPNSMRCLTKDEIRVVILIVRLNADCAESFYVGRGVDHRILDIFVS